MRRLTILVVLLAALLLSGRAGAQDFIRYYPPAISPSGGTFTGAVLVPDGSSAAPTLRRTGDATGLWFGSNAIRFATSGGTYTQISGSGYMAANDALFGWTSGGVASTGVDTYLNRGSAAGILNFQGVKTLVMHDSLNSVGVGGALNATHTGGWNVALGKNALDSDTTGETNTAVGFDALTANTDGNYNVAVGFNALASNVHGLHNVAVGPGALYSTNGTGVTGSYNVAIGSATLQDNTTAGYGVAIGHEALRFNTTGVSNTAVGELAMRANTEGERNQGVGLHALAGNTTGDDNVAIGSYAGRAPGGIGNTANGNTTGNNNTYLGSYTGSNSSTQRDNTTALGYGALNTASNQVSLGDSNVTSLLFGGTAGLSQDVVVKGSDGNNCTLTFKGGLLTVETCP